MIFHSISHFLYCCRFFVGYNHLVVCVQIMRSHTDPGLAGVGKVKIPFFYGKSLYRRKCHNKSQQQYDCFFQILFHKKFPLSYVIYRIYTEYYINAYNSI